MLAHGSKIYLIVANSAVASIWFLHCEFMKLSMYYYNTLDVSAAHTHSIYCVAGQPILVIALKRYA